MSERGNGCAVCGESGYWVGFSPRHGEYRCANHASYRESPATTRDRMDDDETHAFDLAWVAWRDEAFRTLTPWEGFAAGWKSARLWERERDGNV